MIGWIIGLVVIGLIIVGIIEIICFTLDLEGKTKTIIGIIATVVVAIIIVVIALIVSKTEYGKRLIKDTKSNFQGGIDRTIVVYDFEGDEISRYEGKFDIDSSSEGELKFEDENGKRHIIYYSTGTIFVDEK
jgi:hypothetical protein